MRRHLLSSLVALSMCLAAGPAASAQDRGTPGQAAPAASGQTASPRCACRVAGIVTAPDGARLPGATVTITDPNAGRSLVVVTAGHGAFSGSNLPPGEYDVTVELAGFETRVVRGVAVADGLSREVHITLPLSTFVETVTVEGALVKDSIESSEIRDSSARDVGEALGGLNGVAMVRKGAIANDIVLQGYQSRNLTVLIDGDRIHGACPNGMDPAVFHADFAEVDHLEIAKGPFDVRHQGSLGGLVNVVTRAPGTGVHGSASVSAGSWGYLNPSVVGSWGTRGLAALGGYSFRASDAYRDGAGAVFTRYANFKPGMDAASAFEARTGWVRLHASPRPDHSAQLSYTRQQADEVMYPYLLMDGITDNADRLSLRYGITPGSGPVRSVSARAYYSAVAHWMTDEHRVSSAGMAREYSMATQADAKTAGGSVEVALGDVTAGVEAYRRSWEATTVMAGSKYASQYTIPSAATDHVGVFADVERPVGYRTKIAAGGRFDYSRSEADAARANTDLYFAYHGTRGVAATDAGASGKIRVVRQIGESLDISAGLGHTFRVPDPQERFLALKRMGADWVGNPGLRPTRNTGLQMGANYHGRRILASASLSRDWLSNYITVVGQRRANAVAGVMNAAARSYGNVDARMLTGEVSLTWPATDRLFVTASGALTRATKSTRPEAGITSANVAEIPPARGTIGVRYDRAVVFAEAQGVFAARQDRVDADLRESPTPGYGVMNLRVGARKAGVRLTVALENVFNRFYVGHTSFQRDPYRTGVRVPEPGRNLHANVSYRF